jgi:hypothetical protein
MTKCKKHPKYKAVYKPRAKCPTCEVIFREKIISIIAKKFLNIDDSSVYDCYNLSVDNVKYALDLSYRLGKFGVSNTLFNEFWVNKD